MSFSSTRVFFISISIKLKISVPLDFYSISLILTGPSKVLTQQFSISSTCLGSLKAATIETFCKNGALKTKQSKKPFSLGVVSIQTKGLFLPRFLYFKVLYSIKEVTIVKG